MSQLQQVDSMALLRSNIESKAQRVIFWKPLEVIALSGQFLA